jgi:DNA mismatch repair protein MutS
MKVTPIRRQYLDIKNRYPGIIVFFRLGDFYETFDDDARIVSRELEITLTSKEMGKGYRVPLAGIPYHAVDNYLFKLINKGYKVAICEQLGVPGKGLVERDVVRIVTPGTVIEPTLLKENSNNFLVSIDTGDNSVGLAYVDITTGEFVTAELLHSQLADELERLQPAEVLISSKSVNIDSYYFGSITKLDDYWYELDTARQILIEHFKVINLEGFGCEHLPLAIKASGAIIHYISETQKSALDLIKQLSTYSVQSFMTVDHQTRRNLELFNSSRWETASNSLLSVIDLTITSMGGRLMRKWLGQPLLNIDDIGYRQNCISFFYTNNIVRNKVTGLLIGFTDLERIINRIKSGNAWPRDLIALSNSLGKTPELLALIQDCQELNILKTRLTTFNEVIGLIEKSIENDPGVRIEKGGVIKKSFSNELDALRNMAYKSKQYIAALEQEERKRTGIKSLKVQYNRVFGYFIEVSKSNLELVPDDYIRKQTLVNCERFYTPDLKEYEVAVLNAQDKIKELETSIFRDICLQVSGHSESIIEAAKSIAEIDVYSGLAEVAVNRHYIKPVLNNGNAIKIKGGRHPVVEKNLSYESFIPNDTVLDNEEIQIIILTGPNMSGKSTYLKQVALIVLLAQIGSYIPADSAEIGIVDRIFTRIGAQEDLAAGQSTFMVEMTETANILNNATARSLVILDEVGRGTSTYDGLSIAWAIVEYLHNKPKTRAKTLFATHYHELVELASTLPRVKNYNVLVTEEDEKIVFLRKIVPGSTDKSYGIHVAQIAGIPSSVLHRAQEILSNLENNNRNGGRYRKVDNQREKQISLFDQSNAVTEEILKTDIDSITPLDAITLLYDLKQKARKMKGDNFK